MSAVVCETCGQGIYKATQQIRAYKHGIPTAKVVVRGSLVWHKRCWEFVGKEEYERKPHNDR